MSANQENNAPFDWQEFHRLLDHALVDWLIDNIKASVNDPFIDFAEYSNRRQLEQMTKNIRDPKNWEDVEDGE